MKPIQLLYLLLLLLSHPTFAAAVPGAGETQRDADHAALRQLRDRLVTAINHQDGAALAPYFTKEFAFTTVTQEALTNREQVEAYFERMFRAADAPVRAMTTEPTSDILTRFIDENTGVCYGGTKDTYTLQSGQVVTMNNRWSATVVKEDGQWKVAMAHIGTDFLHNPVLTRAAALARNLAVGAGIGGLILGLVVGRWLGGRNKDRGTVNG